VAPVLSLKGWAVVHVSSCKLSDVFGGSQAASEPKSELTSGFFLGRLILVAEIKHQM
jgi:hypothetical protein